MVISRALTLIPSVTTTFQISSHSHEWIWGDATHPDAQPWKETPNAVEEQALALRNAGLSQEQWEHQTLPLSAALPEG